MKDKEALRAAFKALRARIPPEVRAEAGQRLAERICSFEPFRNARAAAAFASFRDEIPTDSVVKALRARGTRVLLPRVEPRANRMVVCDFSEIGSLDRDRFGIPEPDGPVFTASLDLCFVPGLAFGLDGSRLGYGGGFYDRFLASPQCRRAWLCGLGYDAQVVQSLPMQAHDVRLTHIATPDRVVHCSLG